MNLFKIFFKPAFLLVFLTDAHDLCCVRGRGGGGGAARFLKPLPYSVHFRTKSVIT